MTIIAAFIGTLEDVQYIPYLKPMFSGITTYVSVKPIEYLTSLDIYVAGKSVNRIATTSTALLKKLLELQGSASKPSLDNYAGSIFEYKGMEILFIPPLKHLFTVTYGKFIAKRYISKLTEASSWDEPTDFTWELLKPENMETIYKACFKNAYAIAVDIETFKENLAIRCIGYTVISNTFETESFVLPIDSEWALYWMRKLNDLPAQKIFQNGKYDNLYLLRYNAPVRNWLWDTAHFMHSWYSELPKDLAFLNAFFLRKVVYWKDLAETNDLHEYYKYNALDTWATANVWIQQIKQSPDWAKHNYSLEFPLVFPCLLSELTGIKRDSVRLLEARKSVDARIDKELLSLRNCLGLPNFNTNSPVQVKQLLTVLGCAHLDSTDEINLKKAAYLHPLNDFLLEKILDIRGLRKLASTYLCTGDEAKELNGRILYSLNPHGTDTGRLAARESAFWCGINIQNVTTVDKAPEPKDTLCANEGFYLGECDLAQAESRDTAYISGDKGYIAAVTGINDFHSVNTAAFFGVQYDDIYDNAAKKTKNKTLRDLAKRTNHGANYNMGPNVMVNTMGLKKIWEARRLLKLDHLKEPKEIAEYLLHRFHTTYPGIKRDYYASVINEIGNMARLTGRAFHHTRYNKESRKEIEYIERGDWTRYCFGNPSKNKRDLNAYVAHGPQSLNSRTLNEAYMQVFYKVALPNPTTFRLHAQIHDSILFSYKEGFQLHAISVQAEMQIPVTIRNVLGKYDTFTVPADLKLGKINKETGVLKRAVYWSETE